MKRHRTRILILVLWVLFVPVSLARSSPAFSVGQPVEDLMDDKWQLLSGPQKVGFLQSIGGKPRILKAEKRAGPAKNMLWLLWYDAGAAGTKSISQLDRLAVLSENPSKKSFQVKLDIPIKLTRYEGAKVQLSLSRSIDWSADNKTLMLGALDEFPISRYVWKKNTFVRVE